MALAYFPKHQIKKNTTNANDTNVNVSLNDVASASTFSSLKNPSSQPQTKSKKSNYLQEVIEQNQQLQRQLNDANKQNEYFAQLIDAMPTGVVLLDGNGIVIKVNPIAHKLLDEPILGQPWFDVIQRSFKPREDDWHEVSLKDGRRVKLEIQAISGQPGQLITITDLTETRLLQDKISKMQRLSSLGKMVSSLAHQIRTPLSSAILYGANLASEKISTKARSGFQQKLMSRLNDLESQVNDMLLFAKSGEKQIVDKIAVNELVAEAVKAMEVQIQQKQAKVNVSGLLTSGMVLGNKTALLGAIHNLIDNSLQIIPENAVIDVSTFYQKESVFISVKDNGKGIDPALAHKIFDPFYTTRVQGTGLGLAVVKSVAQAHKGDIQLISRLGEGAHFCIKLPLISAVETVESQTKQSHLSMTNPTQEATHE